MEKQDERQWKIAVAVLVLLLAGLQIWHVSTIPGPVVYGDELLYRKRAAELFYEHKYYSSSYPPGYPALICIAFFFENFYFAARIINVLLLMLGNIAVWEILRLFTNGKMSFIGAMLCSLLPWQLYSCGRLASEALFYPLLLWTVYFFLRTFFCEKISKGYCIFLGLLFAAMQLTRHMAIIFFPAFIIAWLVKLSPQKRVYIDLSQVKPGFCILGGYTGGYGIWFVSRILYGENVQRILGFNISNGVGSSEISSYATFPMFLKLAALYIGYLLLTLLFLSIPCICGIVKSIKQKWSEQLLRLEILILGMAGMNLFATVRHSWRSEYNYPNIQYIIGRYLIYTVILLIILTVIFQAKIDYQRDIKLISIVTLVYCFMFYVSGEILLRGKWFGLRERFLESSNTKDVFFEYHIFSLILILGIILLIIACIRNKWYQQVLLIFTVSLLCVGNLYAMRDDSEKRGVFGYTLSEIHRQMDLTNYSYIINQTPAPDIVSDIEFWTGVTKKPVKAKSVITEGELILAEGNQALSSSFSGYYDGYYEINVIEPELFSVLQELPAGQGILFCPKDAQLSETLLSECEYKGVSYGAYVLPLIKSITLSNPSPKVIVKNQKFNIQDNGSSALLIETDLPEGSYSLEINQLPDYVLTVNKDGMGSVLIDDALISESNELKIVIAQDENIIIQKTSNTLTIPIIEGAE